MPACDRGRERRAEGDGRWTARANRSTAGASPRPSRRRRSRPCGPPPRAARPSRQQVVNPEAPAIHVSVPARARRLIRGAADPRYGFPDDSEPASLVETIVVRSTWVSTVRSSASPRPTPRSTGSTGWRSRSSRTSATRSPASFAPTAITTMRPRSPSSESPCSPAWVVNQLARERRADVEALVEAAAAIRAGKPDADGAVSDDGRRPRPARRVTCSRRPIAVRRPNCPFVRADHLGEHGARGERLHLP